MKMFKNIRFTRNTEDEFARCAEEHNEVRPNAARWFCGMGDLDYTFVCRAL